MSKKIPREIRQKEIESIRGAAKKAGRKKDVVIGKPAKYPTEEEFAKAIDDFFEDCRQKNYPPTVVGLALSLGFLDRRSIYDYAVRKKEPYAYSVKRALMKIEQMHEAALATRQTPTGNIFWLKNHNWSDKQELEHTGSGLNVNVNIQPMKGTLKKNTNGD